MVDDCLYTSYMDCLKRMSGLFLYHQPFHRFFFIFSLKPARMMFAEFTKLDFVNFFCNFAGKLF